MVVYGFVLVGIKQFKRLSDLLLLFLCQFTSLASPAFIHGKIGPVNDAKSETFLVTGFETGPNKFIKKFKFRTLYFVVGWIHTPITDKIELN